MSLYLKRKLLSFQGFRDEEGGGGEGGGGGSGGTGDDDAKKAAEAAAAAAAEAARKAEEEKKKKSSGPTDAEAELLKENMKRKADLKAANDALKEAQERLKAYEGIDPAVAKKLLDDQRAAKEAQLAAQGEWDTLKKQMNDAHAAEIKSRDEKAAAIEAENKTLAKQIADLTVGQAFANSPYIKEEMVLTPAKTRAVYGSHFSFVDGKVVGYDRPAGESNRTMLIDGKGEPLSFEAALKKLVEMDPEHDDMLKSKIKEGAGSSSDGTKKPTKATEQGLTGRARIAAGLAALGKR